MLCAVSVVGSACGSNDKPGTVGSAAPARPAPGATNRGTAVSGHPATGTRAPSRAPASPSAGAGSETAAFTRTVLPASTPVSSAEYHDALVKAVETAGKTPKTGEAIASCLQQILQHAGIETVGEADKLKRNPTSNKQVADGAVQCLASAAP